MAMDILMVNQQRFSFFRFLRSTQGKVGQFVDWTGYSGIQLVNTSDLNEGPVRLGNRTYLELEDRTIKSVLRTGG